MSSKFDSKHNLSIQNNIHFHDKDSVNRLPDNSSFEKYHLKPIKEEEMIPNTNEDIEEQLRKKKEDQEKIQMQAEDTEKCLSSKSEEHLDDNNDNNELKNMMKTIKDLTDDVQYLHRIVSEYPLPN